MTLQFDIDAQVDFLVGLLNTPSPTGYHVEAIAYVQERFTALNIPDLTIRTTNKGALLAIWDGEKHDAPRGVTAHTDTLGLMVKSIRSDGTLQATNLGGILWPGIEFENVTVRTFDDRRYRGTVMLANPSVHVNRDAARRDRNADTMVIRLDERVNSASDVERLGIGVGDFIFLDPRVEVLESGFIRSRFLDDKACVANIYGALVALRDAGLRPKQTTAFLISIYEEVGHGGASGWPFELAELLTVDMAALGDGQTGDEFSATICVKDSTGPYHFDMITKLRQLAQAHEIAYKVDIYPYYGSDGSAYWRAGGDARVGLIGPGVASSHGYERTHRDALLHSTHLIARYLLAD